MGLRLQILLFFGLIFVSACTFYGHRPAHAFSEATGGEDLEQVFWKEVKAGHWADVDRVLASNYLGTTPAETLDRTAALEQYHQWQLKHYSLGDVRTELNGTTIVVTYTITLVGTAGSQPLPSAPLRMMSVWQEQKAGWVMIAHSVSQP